MRLLYFFITYTRNMMPIQIKIDVKNETVSIKAMRERHKKIFGAGYYAGIKDANEKLRGDGRAFFNARNSMLCWKPGTDDVCLLAWPSERELSSGYMTTLACNTELQEMSFEQRKAYVFIQVAHLIIRDKVDPVSVHKALLNLEEYRDGCADDLICEG